MSKYYYTQLLERITLDESHIINFCEHNNINYESLNEDQIEEIKGFLKKMGGVGKKIGGAAKKAALAGAVAATCIGASCSKEPPSKNFPPSLGQGKVVQNKNL